MLGPQASGNAYGFHGFAQECMAEQDLDRWKMPELTDAGELGSYVMRAAKVP